MNLADKPVYSAVADKSTDDFYESGLTYKQWLVGMLASNSMVQRITFSDTPLISRTWDLDKTAKVIIDQADAIIKQLEKK